MYLVMSPSGVTDASGRTSVAARMQAPAGREQTYLVQEGWRDVVSIFHVIEIALCLRQVLVRGHDGLVGRVAGLALEQAVHHVATAHNVLLQKITAL